MVHAKANLLSLATMAFILLSATPGVSQVTFTEITVDNNSHGNASLYAFDLDNDGQLEILGAVIEDNAIVFWKTFDGGTTWFKITIASYFTGARSVHAADIDGDGDLDVVGAGYDGNMVAWWSNGGGMMPTWTFGLIDGSYSFPHEVFASDMDGDGHMDILCASSTLNRVTWWRNSGTDPIVWTEQTIASSFRMAKSVCSGDMDNDGHLDVIAAGLQDNRVYWWRNNGAYPITWEARMIDVTFGGAHRVQAVDVDSDGDLDVVGAGYTGHVVGWWRNDNGTPIKWTRQIIGYGVTNACIAQASDIDGDGIMDVVATAQGTGEISWWHNNGQEPITWTKHSLANLYRVWPLYCGDLDGDGDTDLLAGSSHRGNNEVKLYRNDSQVSAINDNDLPESGWSLGLQGYPNPFNPWVTLNYRLAQAGNVEVAVFDLAGRKMAELLNGVQHEGQHSLVWRGVDQKGRSVPSGTYLVHVKSGVQVDTVRVILAK